MEIVPTGSTVLPKQNIADQVADAIRLKKGGAPPGTGMTIATDAAIYVQGDYNHRHDLQRLRQPRQCRSDDQAARVVAPSRYTVPGYTRRPAPVMGDAVLLFNAWTDTTSSISIGTRNAIPTTMNSAIVSSQGLTNGTSASSGTRKFRCVLENWRGDNFTYHATGCQFSAGRTIGWNSHTDFSGRHITVTWCL